MRKIIHVDLDCFYAAVEMRDNPALANLPVAVGGQPHSRGVISTCNYEARRYGVHSAMPSAHAARLCPDLVFVKTNMAKYKQESQRVRKIMSRYSEKLEPLSLDEAYLDVTDSPHCQGSATWIAEAICAEIFETCKLTASAGVARTKFLAKVASDWNKPNGIKVVLPQDEGTFIDMLPVKKLHGVGKVMARKLEAMDVFNCRELRQIELEVLLKRFGKMGKYLYDLCRGIDLREVRCDSHRKSLSVETTFSENIESWEECENALHRLVSSLSQRLEKAGNVERIRKVYVKIKQENFQIHSAESISIGLDIKLLVALLKRLRVQYSKPIRLMGIGVRFPQESTGLNAQQLKIPF
ncbi:DNA polymerase IV [Aliikangiella sp. IMCC44632]